MNTYSIIAILIIILPLIFAFRKRIMVSQLIVLSAFVVYFLILFLRTLFLEDLEQFYYDLAFKPIYLKTGEKIYTIFTSMYLHGGLLHVLMNMFILILAGIPFEERIGAKKFAIIYFVSGVIATILFSFIDLNSTAFLIGASGAIFGILGAFATLYPRDEVFMPLFIIFAKVPVLFAVVLFLALETLYVAFAIQDNVAHIAHIGGLITGVVLALLLKGKAQKEIKAENVSIKSLATTDELKELLQKIEKEDIKEIKEVWIEEFLKKANCPKCNKKLMLKGNFAYSECGFVLKWR